LKGLRKVGPLRKGLLGLVLLTVVGCVSGCHTLGFYGQAIKGQYQILAHQKPIEKLLTDTQTPAPLTERFKLVQELHAFAKEHLKLPANGHYRKYVDVHRPYVVWNVEAAPEFSLQPKTWWYPLVGSLSYRGYFSNAGATNYAKYLRNKGYDVSVGGVQAYSTLGWFKDPVLNTFIFEPDADLAEILFHELGHQRLFARGDTDFNEAFATTVGQEGVRRWLKAKGDEQGLSTYLAHIRHTDEFVRLVMKTRARLETIYGDEVTEDGKVRATRTRQDATRQLLRQQKQEALDDFKKEYSQARAGWGDDAQYEWWFQDRVNNAHLNSVAAYYELVPGFEQLLAQNAGDLEKFYAAADRLSEKSRKERHEELRSLARRSRETVAAR
jgi:predicted aminopeptidase